MLKIDSESRALHWVLRFFKHVGKTCFKINQRRGWLLSILLLNSRNKGLFATWLTLLLTLDSVNIHRPCTLRLPALFWVLLVTTLAVTSFYKIFSILNAFSKQYGIRQDTYISVHQNPTLNIRFEPLYKAVENLVIVD